MSNGLKTKLVNFETSWTYIELTQTSGVLTIFYSKLKDNGQSLVSNIWRNIQTHNVMIYKIIHVYYLNNLHDSLKKSCD